MGLYEQFASIDRLKGLVQSKIKKLKDIIEEAQKELELWQTILKLSETCNELAEKEAAELKNKQLKYKWIGTIKDCWVSEAGSVNKKAWGKYVGFPACLQHLAPTADGDRGTHHMAHRPSRTLYDLDTTDFDTLIDCQLAIEQIHQEWQEKNPKK